MSSKNPALTSIIIGLLVVVALIWVGFRSRTTPPLPAQTNLPNIAQPLSADPVKVGWLGPLSGDQANLGQDIKRGVELAHRQVNANVEIIFVDTKCDSASAVAAVHKLIDTDQVQAIIGDACSEATLAVAPIAALNEIPLVSATATSPELTALDEYTFRVIPSAASHALFVADQLANKGFDQLAILYSDDESGREFQRVLVEALASADDAVCVDDHRCGNAADTVG